MSSEKVIEVSGLAKSYQIYERPNDRLKQFVMPRLQTLFGLKKTRYFREFWALSGIEFDVRKGETVGIVGRNGSGKSTLLQMICGTLNPTSGQIKTNGRIAALLELGSGFNPEFTGRENVYLNASLLGLSKPKIDERFAAIEKFAEIGEFIDQAVKTYSSGMMVRLAFAVIVHVDADILVVDEALSVGDVFFSQKCMRFFEDYKAGGGTVLFVSHDTAAVTKLCDRAILLKSGKMVKAGSADQVCKFYLQQIYDERLPAEVGQSDTTTSTPKPPRISLTAEKQKTNTIAVSPFNRNSEAFGLMGVRITDAGFFGDDDRRLTFVEGEQETRFKIVLESVKEVSFPAVGIIVKDRLGQAIYTEGTTWAFENSYSKDGLHFYPGDTATVTFDFKMPILIEGEYAITTAVAEGFGHDHVQHHLLHEAIILTSLSSRLLHGISGFNDLKISIDIDRPHVSSSTTTCEK